MLVHIMIEYYIDLVATVYVAIIIPVQILEPGQNVFPIRLQCSSRAIRLPSTPPLCTRKSEPIPRPLVNTKEISPFPGVGGPYKRAPGLVPYSR
jgi:hypothetical protein